MKSGSMSAFEQARNIEDAIDGAPDAPAKKPPRELTLAAATKQILKIRRSIPAELAAAKQKVLDDAATREAKVLERVHEEARGIVRREADKEWPAEAAAAPDVEYEHPDVADEPTPEPAVDDVPERLREPLSPERLAVARGGKR